MKKLFSAVLSVLFLALALGVVGSLRFIAAAEALVIRLFERAAPGEQKVVTADMLDALPPPVQRYLRYSGVVGKTIPRTVWLEQHGRIRSAEDAPWMEYVAEEFYTISPPSFVWHAGVRIAGLPLVRVRDSYAFGRGNILVKALGLFTLQDATGPEMEQASLIRYLNEMMWFPAAFLRDNISWEAIDEQSARVTLTDDGRSVSAVLTFDEEGRLINFVGDRYDISGGQPQLLPWATPIAAYGEFEGVRVPASGEGIWQQPSGDFTYIELDVVDLTYDVPAP